MRFEELKIEGSLIEKCRENGILEPTEIQERAIPSILGGSDIIAISQTGSGKTLAFVLPVVSNLLNRNRSFYCLVVTPTRELSLQIADCFKMFQDTGLRVCSLVGGESFSHQAYALSKQPHIVIGTPGRVAEHVLKTKSFKTGKIRKLVLDEADRFFEQDFTDDLETILANLRERRQTLLFTATMSENISKMSETLLRRPRLLDITNNERVAGLTEYYFLVSMNKKNFALVGLLRMRSEVSVILFVSMCMSAQTISIALNSLGISAEALYGELDQKKREDIMRRFRDGGFSVLVCTDLGSRGLDIKHVDLVINFDPPSSGKDYIHRVGRTARAGKPGVAITFITQYDVEQLQKLEFSIGRRIEKFTQLESVKVEDKIRDAFLDAQERLKENSKMKRRKRASMRH